MPDDGEVAGPALEVAELAVERLALGEALLDVDDDHVGVIAARELLHAGGADIPGHDDGDLPALAQGTRTPSFSMIASATPLVPTALGSARETLRTIGGNA